MKIFFAFLVILTFPLFTFSQVNNYWVKFKDKSNNPFSLGNPQQFLSQRSIDRRTQQGIALDSTDLPLTPAYVDSVAAYSTKLVHRLKWSNLVVVTVNDPSNLQIIKSFPFVDSVNSIEYYPSRSVQNKMENDYPISEDVVSPNPVYGLAYRQIEMMNGDLLHQMGYRGQGVIIAVMDNGLLGEPGNPAFDSVQPRILLTWNFVFNQQNINNDGGHGVETFGCIAGNIPGRYVGTAPDASFFLFQTEQNDAEWVMEEYNWADAAEMADSAGAQIFTTSLGYTQFNNPIDSSTIDPVSSHTYADLSGDKTVITHASNQAFSKGILVFNSAGNEGNQGWHYIIAPADGDSIIAVGAVDSSENIADFSSRGPNAAGVLKPDVCAMGAEAYVTNAAFGISASSGTSFSCPILAGCAACLWQAFPQKTARQIKEAIIRSANRYSTPDINYGYGIPNFYNAYAFLKTNYDSSVLNYNGGLTVYPNPFSNSLNISVYSSTLGRHSIDLFDILGQKVYSTTFIVRDKTFSLATIEGMDALPAGEYFLRFDGDNRAIQTILKEPVK